ncbi:MAG TPA: glycosyltransferase family 87 protein [Anaerolineae bacterium]|nr:glycosyltransferase family 87 protein [Anaerolineae bacterium]
MRTVVQRFSLRWHRASLIVLLLVVCLIFAVHTFWPARSATVHGFPVYYTAGWLFANGQWGPNAYDDIWFGDRVEFLTQNGVREIYAPSPPLLTVFFALFAGLDIAAARDVWAWLNVLMLMISLGLIIGALARFRGSAWRVASIGFALLAAPTREHFHLGQVYILLLLFFALAFWLAQHQHQIFAGAALGVALVTKLSGLPLLFTLLAQRQWRLSVSVMITAGSLGVGGLLLMGLPTWQAFAQTLIDRLTNYPIIAVTAFQSTSSLFHHLFVYDAQWSPQPIWSQPWLAPLLTWSIFFGAVIITMRRARHSVLDVAFAAGTTLSVILLPLAEEYHYVLLLLPLAVMMARVLQTPYSLRNLIWPTIIIFLIGWPLPYTDPELTRGWLSVLAYPRLYGGWLLWLWHIRRMNVEKTSP